MVKNFAKYMKWGKTVESNWTGEVFKLIEDMGDGDTVKAVSLTNWRRYDLLKAWIRNWESNSCGFRERFEKDGKNIEDCKTEKQGYEEELKISEITPHDKIRFITPSYETKFEVADLSLVSVNGTAARVAYIDEYHFTFADKINVNLYGGCFHICQFAEICEKENIEVKPIEKVFLPVK